MTSWLEKAKARFSQNSQAHTDETDESGVSSVLSVRSCRFIEKVNRVSSVSSVCSERIFEKPDLSDPVLKALLAAAMLACDFWKDGPEAREQMRRDVEATPEHLRADLLDYFLQSYS